MGGVRTLLPFRNRPGPRRQHAPRPPAAGGRLELPDTAPLRNQVEECAVPVIGYRSGGSAETLLPPRSARGLHETGYVEGQIVIILGLSFLDTLRRMEHVARGSPWKRFDVTAQ